MTRRALLAAALAALPALAVAKEEKKKKGGESYVPIPTLLGTTRRPGGRRGVLTVECGLDIPDGRLRELAELSLPRLRSAYAETVQAYAGGLPTGSAPDAEFLAQALQRNTDAVLGRRGARLLLGTVLVN
jgi:hypothetical protein